MPYALSEKQKEYQREWARKRKGQKRLVVTWDQLTGKWHNVKSYKECVKQGRVLTVTYKGHRLDIAQLCLRACQIRHGGDMRSDEAKASSHKTMKNFAEDIGVSYKALTNWVYVKTGIYDKLPEGHKKWGVNFSSVRMAKDHVGVGSVTEEVLDRYMELSAMPIERRNKLKRIDDLRLVSNYFAKRPKVTEAEIEKILEYTDIIEKGIL